VDIFSDALASVGEDDALIGSKMENQLKELRNFTDLEFSKNKSLACIDWHPTSKGVLAVSVCKTLSFDDRVSVSGQVDVAYVIVWEFAEWIKPQLVLQTPHECFTFKCVLARASERASEAKRELRRTRACDRSERKEVLERASQESERASERCERTSDASARAHERRERTSAKKS
jgi:hypothetical protein